MLTSKKKRHTPTIADPRQGDFLAALGGELPELIDVPAEPEQKPGAFVFDAIIRQALNGAIDAAPFNREQLAEMLSELVGRPITKPMLDTYTGASRPNRLPADLLPALTVILGPELLARIGAACGCAVMERPQAMMARLGQLQVIAVQVAQEQQAMIAQLPIFGGAHHV